jgi:hypothetical protein
MYEMIVVIVVVLTFVLYTISIGRATDRMQSQIKQALSDRDEHLRAHRWVLAGEQEAVSRHITDKWCKRTGKNPLRLPNDIVWSLVVFSDSEVRDLNLKNTSDWLRFKEGYRRMAKQLDPTFD